MPHSNQIKRQYIDGPHGQIHIAESGQGQPILLIHQTPRSWDEFREVITQLSHKHRVIAMDLPGMGASQAVTGTATIEAYASAAAAVANWIDNEQLIVCGHHTGGVVAIELAAKHPSLVYSLVLSSTPWIDQQARELRSKKVPIDTATPEISGSHLVDLWEQRRPFYPDQCDYLDRFIKDALCARNPAEGHVAVSNYKMELNAPKITCPVLLVEHQQDQFATKYTNSLINAFPKAQLQRIKNGHVALEVAAEEFSNVLLSWLSKPHALNVA